MNLHLNKLRFPCAWKDLPLNDVHITSCFWRKPTIDHRPAGPSIPCSSIGSKIRQPLRSFSTGWSAVCRMEWCEMDFAAIHSISLLRVIKQVSHQGFLCLGFEGVRPPKWWFCFWFPFETSKKGLTSKKRKKTTTCWAYCTLFCKTLALFVPKCQPTRPHWVERGASLLRVPEKVLRLAE